MRKNEKKSGYDPSQHGMAEYNSFHLLNEDEFADDVNSEGVNPALSARRYAQLVYCVNSTGGGSTSGVNTLDGMKGNLKLIEGDGITITDDNVGKNITISSIPSPAPDNHSRDAIANIIGGGEPFSGNIPITLTSTSGLINEISGKLNGIIPVESISFLDGSKIESVTSGLVLSGNTYENTDENANENTAVLNVAGIKKIKSDIDIQIENDLKLYAKKSEDLLSFSVDGGVNTHGTLNLKAGSNIELVQNENEVTINSTSGDHQDLLAEKQIALLQGTEDFQDNPPTTLSAVVEDFSNLTNGITNFDQIKIDNSVMKGVSSSYTSPSSDVFANSLAVSNLHKLVPKQYIESLSASTGDAGIVSGQVKLEAGTNMSIVRSGQNITFNSTGNTEEGVKTLENLSGDLKLTSEHGTITISTSGNNIINLETATTSGNIDIPARNQIKLIQGTFNWDDTPPIQLSGINDDIISLSGLINEINDDIVSLSGSIDETNDNIVSLSGSIDETNDNIVSLSGSINDINGDIVSLSGSIDETNDELSTHNIKSARDGIGTTVTIDEDGTLTVNVTHEPKVNAVWDDFKWNDGSIWYNEENNEDFKDTLKSIINELIKLELNK